MRHNLTPATAATLAAVLDRLAADAERNGGAVVLEFERGGRIHTGVTDHGIIRSEGWLIP